MNSDRYILSAGALSADLRQYASDNGCAVDVAEFTRIDPVNDSELTEEVLHFCDLPITAVFTSVNAVKALRTMVGERKPDWTVYCIGHSTLAKAIDLFGEERIAGVADNAGDLAELILEHEVAEVVFFCGDKRMDTLPNTLEAEGVTLYELVLYSTIETPKPVEHSYDAILFYSPSAVRSYFAANTPGRHTALFAIGDTTASEVKEHSDNLLFTSTTPTKEVVIQMAVQYLQSRLPAQQHEND